MYLRLAFAIAAHLEPEILLVDEVLAVGDAGFQKKCLNKMQDVGEQGRTVLFVSHNMPTITRLCDRAIMLDEGRILHDGPSHQVVRAYLDSGSGTAAERHWPDLAKAPGGEVVRLCAVRVQTENGRSTDVVDIRQPIRIEMEYEVLKSGYVLLPHFDLINERGVLVFVTLDQDVTWRDRPRPAGRYVSTAWIPGNFLSEGTMSVHSLLFTMNPVPSYQFILREAVAFQVIDKLEGDSARGNFAGHLGGVVRPVLKWTTRFSPNEASVKTDGLGACLG
jgi:lipopolysaccharide transport system ATP-binding protein